MRKWSAMKTYEVHAKTTDGKYTHQATIDQQCFNSFSKRIFMHMAWYSTFTNVQSQHGSLFFSVPSPPPPPPPLFFNSTELMKNSASSLISSYQMLKTFSKNVLMVIWINSQKLKLAQSLPHRKNNWECEHMKRKHFLDKNFPVHYRSTKCKKCPCPAIKTNLQIIPSHLSSFFFLSFFFFSF